MIHTSHLISNFLALKEGSGDGVGLCVAVKANAYGHGASVVAPLLAQAGADAFGVATVEEGLELRQLGIDRPILVFGALQDDEWVAAARADLQVFLSSSRQLPLLKDAARGSGRPLKVHLKVDTGMGRLGCAPEVAVDLAAELVHALPLEFEGLCTHFASSEAPGPVTVAQQVAVFRGVLDALHARGLHPRQVHASNSGAILCPPELAVTMTRPGIALYGYHPAGVPDARLKPVMELVSRVAFVKTVAAGTPLSYGSRYTTTQRTDVVTIPVGYADGYRRSLTNTAPVWIRDRLHTVSGTVCMDQLVVDVGPDSGVAEGDEVVLLGPNHAQRTAQAPTADDLARLAGTISYELLCGIAARVPRVAVS